MAGIETNSKIRKCGNSKIAELGLGVPGKITNINVVARRISPLIKKDKENNDKSRWTGNTRRCNQL